MVTYFQALKEIDARQPHLTLGREEVSGRFAGSTRDDLALPRSYRLAIIILIIIIVIIIIFIIVIIMVIVVVIIVVMVIVIVRVIVIVLVTQNGRLLE